MNLGRELKGLGKSSLIYGLGGVLNRFIGFLLLPVFTSYLTPTEYGISAMLGWISFVVAPVFSLGFGAAMGICYFDGNDPRRKENTVWTSFVVLALSSAVLSIIAVFLPKTISLVAFRTPEYHHLVTLGLLAAAAANISTPFPLYLQFEKRARLYVILNTISTLLSIGFSILLVVVLRRGILGLVEAGLIGSIISSCIIALPAISSIRFKLSRSVAKEMLRHGVPLIPTFAFLFVMMHANKYILQWEHGLGALGIYNIGFGFGTVMMIFVSAFTTAWYAYFMEFMDKPRETPILFGRILTYYILGFGTLTLAFFLVARPVVYFMTKAPFHDSYRVVGMIAGANFLSGVFSILVSTIYFAKKLKHVTLIQMISASICVGVSFPLIMKYGMVGAALSVFIGYLMMAFATHFWNTRLVGADLRVRIEWRRLAPFAVVAVLITSVMLWPRTARIELETIGSCVGLVVLPAISWMLLTSKERSGAVKIVKSYLRNRLAGQPS
jgi:O-antigen/teichoic acid export membrane protein